MDMMKKTYIPPTLEVIQMDGCLAPLCISGDDYTESIGAFDPDSDFFLNP